MELPVYDHEGKVTEKIDFDESVFGAKVRKRLLHEVVTLYQANKRQGTAATKNRRAVVGSRSKPWRQKGTGRARTSSNRNPIWKGGGTTFGPQPRDYYTSIPKKMRRAACNSALLSKFLDDEVKVLDGLAFDEPKTKRMASILSNLKIGGTCLVALKEPDRNVCKSVSNIKGVEVMRLGDLNALEVLKRKVLLVTRDVIDEFGSRGAKP